MVHTLYIKVWRKRICINPVLESVLAQASLSLIWNSFHHFTSLHLFLNDLWPKPLLNPFLILRVCICAHFNSVHVNRCPRSVSLNSIEISVSNRIERFNNKIKLNRNKCGSKIAFNSHTHTHTYR